MTIRLLSAYGKYPINAIVSIDPATEAGLIAAGQATSNTIGGIEYAAPISKTQVGPGVFTYDAVGQVSGLIGQDGGLKRISSLQYPTSRTKFASFGDSIADIGVINNVSAQDIAAANAANANVGLGSEKFGAWLAAHSGGVLKPVFNGGIGGQTTTQIAARAVAASSTASTSKSLVDAQTFGAEFVIVSASVNDFIGVSTASSAAAIEAVKTTALANLKIILNKARSLGIHVIFHSTMPYGKTPLTADQLVVNAATLDYNARVAIDLAACPLVATYYDARTPVTAPDGGWIAAYNNSTDVVATHPNHAGCDLVYPGLSALIMSLSGKFRSRAGLPKAPNMFSNADLSASASGLATGITIASVDGTTINSIQRIDGVSAQSIIWAPSNVTGVDSTLIIDLELLAAGAAPYMSFTAGDTLAMEFDITVDDCLGGAPNVYAISAYLRKNAGLQPTIFNAGYSTYSGTSTLYYKRPFIERICGCDITVDESTAATTGRIFSRVTLVSRTQTAPVRVLLSNIRMVKLPEGY